MPYNFDQLHREYRAKIYRYLGDLVGKDRADDLTQEVFAKVSRTLGSFRGDSQISTWLYRIATNVAMDWLKSSAHRENTKALDIADIAETEHDRNIWTKKAGMAPDELLIRKEMNDCVRNIIDHLPKNARTVIVLSDLEHFTDREIANILNIKTSAVKVRLHRARALLKKELEGNCAFYRTKDNIFACDKKRPVLLSFNKGPG
jgi:RNA polymerase sigma-70 factor (ECF subfamily)